MRPLLTLRPARIADAEGIAHVYVEAWRTAYPGLIPTPILVRMSKRGQAGEWARTLLRRSFIESVQVAELPGGGVAGFGSCGEARDTGLPQAGEIYTLYVLPEYQEKGVGRAVLLRLFDALIDRGLDSAITWVLTQNPARFFYEAMGGRRVAEKNERIGTAILPQTGYGWDDLRLVPRRGDVRTE
jgi:ribosomal protein S18 acetylase RimI-like enzyme